MVHLYYTFIHSENVSIDALHAKYGNRNGDIEFDLVTDEVLEMRPGAKQGAGMSSSVDNICTVFEDNKVVVKTKRTHTWHGRELLDLQTSLKHIKEQTFVFYLNDQDSNSNTEYRLARLVNAGWKRTPSQTPWWAPQD